MRARLSLAWRKDVRVDYCLEFKVRKRKAVMEMRGSGGEERQRR